ncbi:MAG: (4Fe-4S)-binding protein [Algibacter sp.]|uniref:(4Fe-4S)-binding protein n=1 Tax=Algibacter sp. TaxID=1872428 RepID=UPI00262FE158|nr:(4Fe-4S)-binding protein [Algibacter sp.]MDG1729997.1 (4Fe-4S)-binding protein [Algibacter sp.]MDG2177239.1 (4Fe-4S)-binding protein [Algibacter sp.]
MSKTREYTNGAITVVWKPESCIHSAICAKGLPNVFRPKVRPWIRVEKGSTEDLINQVKQCPSGALSYYLNGKKEGGSQVIETKVEVLENGPLLVYGTLKVLGKDGDSEIKSKTTAFCRCGKSNNKPYCDGAHVKVEFKG